MLFAVTQGKIWSSLPWTRYIPVQSSILGATHKKNTLKLEALELVCVKHTTYHMLAHHMNQGKLFYEPQFLTAHRELITPRG